ncbi:MAG: UDP-N-acetylmuramate--L-alanine ligase [Deltaproteobacteria bacterium]
MNKIRKYHLIGIGGIGMSGIARLMRARGMAVSGSDVRQSRSTDELASLGCRICIGHSASNLGDADEVIYSSAIKEDNPEMREARRRGVPVRKRAEALAELMGDKKVITVAGAHGKTTTSSLVSHMLITAGLSPTIAVGGILKNIGNNVREGDGDFFVAEADESDGTFLCYRPTYSIITNIDREHLDYYKDFPSLLEAFGRFIQQTEPKGCLFCGQDQNLVKLMASCRGRSMIFGFSPELDIYASSLRFKGLTSEFDCYRKGEFLARFKLSLGGSHNVSNSLAVIALGMELGIGIGTIGQALATYQGAGRRLDVKLRTDKWTVVDDYGHHPTEIRATLNALSQVESGRRIVVFQPHRYTRTKLLLDEFSGCFAQADHVIITDIYAASEPPIEGITGEFLAGKVRAASPGKTVEYVPRDRLRAHVLGLVRPKDLVATMGAGDITKVSDEIAEELKKQG